MEDFFVCKPRSEAALYDFMSYAENSVKSVTNPKIGTVNSSDTGQRSHCANFAPSMGQKLPTSNTDTEYNDQRKNYSREYTRRFYEKA